MKRVKSINNVNVRSKSVDFQFQYEGGNKENFRCPQNALKDLMLTIVADPSADLPAPGESPLKWIIAEADATGRVAIQLLYSNNKSVALVLDRQSAGKMGAALVQASATH